MTASRSASGLFITFEGGEGAGKSTQAARCAEHLSSRGLEVVVTREPGGTPTAERLREMLLDGGIELAPLEQVLLLYAARHNHVERVIRPAVERGAVVICDRFSDSTRSYQGAAGGVSAETIESVESLVLQGFGPDLTLVLDMPVDAGFERVRSRGEAADRFEAADRSFHESLRRGFLEIARREPERCRVIDAARGIEAVWTDVRDAVEARLSR